MAYIRTKEIKGNIYSYLVEGKRVDGKVKQKVLKYLGPGDLRGQRKGWPEQRRAEQHN